jgi:cytochrome-b5 reductase
LDAAKGDGIMKHVVNLLTSEFATHDTKRFTFEKPAGLELKPGEAAMVAINRPELEDDLHPFTPTSLKEDRVLEFIIKEYPEHHGMTEKLHKLVPGDEIVIKGTYGAIVYKRPGVFIAGGTGITPFIAIFRRLKRDGKLAGNALLFSNKTHDDIILERELRNYLGSNCIFTLTREKRAGYDNRRIDEAYLKEKISDFDQEFYLCGPPNFVEELAQVLQTLGASANHVIFD